MQEATLEFPILDLTPLISTENVDEAMQAVLRDLFSLRLLKEGDVLFRQGEPVKEVYFVLRGRLVTERSDVWGHAAVLCARRGGEILCPLSLMAPDQRFIGTARAVEPTLVLAAPKEKFMEVYQRHPVLRQWAHRQCIMQIFDLVDHAHAVMHYTVEQRLAWLLWQEARMWGRSKPRPNTEIHLTQQELAAWIGTTRETVSRILSQWKRRGWVRVRRGRVIVEQPEALAALLQKREQDGQNVRDMAMAH